jgi:hypothetical protein
VKKEICEQFITECEQAMQKMGFDLYEVMKQAPRIAERYRPYYFVAEKFWASTRNREDAVRLLLDSPDLPPEKVEKVFSVIRTLPYLLRGAFQNIVKALPPSPGGRPHELTPEQRREVCNQIGFLYGQGVELADAKKRMAQRYDVSLSTIQRAWKKRASELVTGIGEPSLGPLQ